MAWLLEDTFPIIAVGLLLEGILLWYLLRGEGGKPAIWGLAVVLALTVAATCLSLWIETEREQITKTLDAIAGLLRKNDIPKVLAFVDPHSPELKSRAEATLSRLHFVSVSNPWGIEVVSQNGSSPEQAKAQFAGQFAVEERGSQGLGGNLPLVHFEASLIKRDGHWLFQECTYEIGPRRQASAGN